jgi:hypothetical protein
MSLPIRLLALAAVAPLVALNAASAQHAAGPSHPETITLDAQGSSPEWDQSPHWREFYTLSVEMLRGNAVDVGAYEQKSYAIFRAFAGSIHADPEGMLDHLKNIPREVVAIVTRDPRVLDSYESFLVALRGPR